MARAVRLGYNVLVMDTDVVVFKDPYQFWKAPPFSNFTILGQAEVRRMPLARRTPSERRAQVRLLSMLSSL